MKASSLRKGVVINEYSWHLRASARRCRWTTTSDRQKSQRKGLNRSMPRGTQQSEMGNPQRTQSV